ncbi:MAG: hypothetical protein K0R46_924 [Herbinix sp.]|jgi:hypothetical protein|nr:hypothetical protein [Herbinix sp.]
MLLFIKNYNLSVLKKKYILLYVLNLTDIIFTILLLQTGYFREVNLIMAKAVEHPVACISFKAILPALLLGYVYRCIKEGGEEQHRISNIAVNISLSVYAFVNLSHLVWSAMLPFLILRNV